MSEDQFVTFQKFTNVEEAEALKRILDEHQIAVELVDSSPNFDITFSGNTLQNEVRLKIRQSDFEKANALLEAQAEKEIAAYPDDHYLYEFEDGELMEILEKPDEWSKEDHMLALKILKDRGKEITEAQLAAMHQERIANLREPVKAELGWLAFAYFLALIVGHIAIFIGWFYLSFKKTIPTGERVYGYDAASRKHGQRIFWLSIISILLWTILIFYQYDLL